MLADLALVRGDRVAFRGCTREIRPTCRPMRRHLPLVGGASDVAIYIGRTHARGNRAALSDRATHDGAARRFIFNRSHVQHERV